MRTIIAAALLLAVPAAVVEATALSVRGNMIVDDGSLSRAIRIGDAVAFRSSGLVAENVITSDSLTTAAIEVIIGSNLVIRDNRIRVFGGGTGILVDRVNGCTIRGNAIQVVRPPILIRYGCKF